MKSTAKLLLAASVGFVSGYMFSVNRARNYYLDMTNDEIHKNKLEYEEQLNLEKKRLEERYEKQLQEYEQEMDQEVQQAAKALTSYQTGEVKEENPIEQSEAVVISDEMFIDNDGDYDQYTLNHYRGDNVLTTQNDEIISEDVRRAWFGNLVGVASPTDGNSVYIRNHKFRKDFEIVVISEAYKDVVLGAGEDG
jgi:hypothetical protein